MNTSLKSVHFPPLTETRFQSSHLVCSHLQVRRERELVQLFAARQKETAHNLLPFLLTIRSMHCAKSMYYTELSAS